MPHLLASLNTIWMLFCFVIVGLLKLHLNLANAHTMLGLSPLHLYASHKALSGCVQSVCHLCSEVPRASQD